MLAMQYTIQLAMNFDMQRIRDRVQMRSKLFADLPGLMHKSYLMSEEDKIYAPFYIWQDVAQARTFMLNDLFKGVIDAFTRPRVRQWTTLSRNWGNRDIVPTHALREGDTIPPEADLEKLVQEEIAAQATLLKNENLHFHLIALDPDRWELLRYSLWKDRASARPQGADYAQSYEVLHLSQAMNAQ